jgi:phosphoribosyl 1,2-cyclic phosphodiesterase
MGSASSARFVVLASGSGGNAAVLDTVAGAVLIDFGLGPRTLDRRLKLAGISWSRIRAVVLTHTHSDHWKRETLSRFVDHRLPVFAADGHSADLASAEVFPALKSGGLFQSYRPGRAFQPVASVSVLPVAVPHDSDPTSAFRFDGNGWSIGYAADLGKIPDPLEESFAGLELLALEFNHDVRMQWESRRPEILIRRVLGDYGHLSNEQAAGFVRRLLDRPGDRLRHLVQLHLSRECNRPAVAAAAARAVLAGTAVQLTTASQDVPTAFLSVGLGEAFLGQPALPGFGD